MKFFESGEFDNKFIDAINKNIPKTSNRFWEFVDKVNWRENGKYKETFVLEEIAPYFTHEEFLDFRDIYENLDTYLSKFLNPIWLGDPGLNVGDDGFWDLRSSIIGYGKDFYLSVIMDDSNKIVTNMVNTNNYRENFSYIFHFTVTNVNRWETIDNEKGK
tara:strand:- start:61387 stop:61866 length:480 start_codon:yes stop_codon:yes gene_type:complete